MRSGLGGFWVATCVGLAVVGCAEPDVGDGEKVARYRFVSSDGGFAVYEKANWIARILSTLFGSTPGPKVEVGPVARGPNAFEVDQIARAQVERRKLVGPEAKPTAMQMPWGVRLQNPEGALLTPFFKFRKEAEAKHFAAVFDARLQSLR